MASITIRKLDDAVKERLRVRAARNGRSMEAEARSILASELASDQTDVENRYRGIRKRIEPLGDVELPEIPRDSVREPQIFVQQDESGDRLLDIIDQLFGPLGGADLPDVPREPGREPPDFGE